MVLIHHFNSTILWKAFVLNALTTSLVILIAIIVKRRLDIDLNVDPKQSVEKFNWYSVTVTLLITFGTSLSAYLIMYIVFGFGGGMLAN